MPKVVARHNTGGSMPHNRPAHIGGGFHRSHSPHYHGGHFHSGRSNGNPICFCICFIPICLLILIITGLAFLFSSNDRVQRIQLYNEYAAEWKSLKSSFQGATFQVNSSPAIMTTVSGKYFPVFDNCINSSGEGACTAAESVFYYSSLSLTGQDSVKVNIKGANGEVLLEESGVTGYYLVYTRSEMSCDPYADDSDSDSCYHKCRSMGGEYSDNRQECRVAYSLVRICLRVDGRNNTYVPDTAHSSRFSANGKGCYYSGGYKPFVYARIYKIPDQISVEIRHYADPVISASLATKGCSDNYAYNDSAHSCFGIKRSTQIAIGICLLAVAAIIIIVSIFLIIKGCNCIKKATNKQSPASVPLTTAIPVATVATAQPAPNTQTPYQSTPMYTIPQNSMAPTQPFLNSQGYQAQYPQIPTAQPMYYAPQTNSAGL